MQTKISTNSSSKLFFVARRSAFVFAAFVSLWFAGTHLAHAATLYLSPGSGTVSVGKSFSVSVIVSSPSQSINAASGTITYPSDLLEVTSLSKSGSIIKFWVQDPSFLNSQGSAKFEGVIYNPGFTGSAGKVITVNFRAKAAGTASIAITDGQVLLNDGNGTEALSGTSGAHYTVTAAAPGAPTSTAPLPGQVVVSSATHPDQNAWYPKADVDLSWSRPSGAYGFSFQLDQKPDTIPDDILDTTTTTAKTYPKLTDGVWYFHIKARPQTPGSQFGPVTHFKIQVDTTPPSSFQITLPAGQTAFSLNSSPTIVFTAQDATSGIDHYEVFVDGALQKQVTDATYSFQALGSGAHTLSVTAYDKAQNSTKADLPITVATLTVQKQLNWIWILLGLSLLLNIILLGALLSRKRKRGEPADEVAILQAEVDAHLDDLKGYINKKLLTLSNKSTGELKKQETAVAKELNADIGDTQESIDKSIGKLRRTKKKTT